VHDASVPGSLQAGYNAEYFAEVKAQSDSILAAD
jgi:hypothetical protein